MIKQLILLVSICCCYCETFCVPLRDSDKRMEQKINNMTCRLRLSRQLSHDDLKQVTDQFKTFLKKIEMRKTLISVKSLLPCYELLFGKHFKCVKEMSHNSDKTSHGSFFYILNPLRK